MLSVTHNYVEGVDFTSGPYNVIFPAGSTNASFSISITNDTIYESYEFFDLIIRKDSLSTCAQNTNSVMAFVLLFDDDVRKFTSIYIKCLYKLANFKAKEVTLLSVV